MYVCINSHVIFLNKGNRGAGAWIKDLTLFSCKDDFVRGSYS